MLDDPVDGREPVEAGDGGEASADGGAGKSGVFESAGPQFEVAAADPEDLQAALVAPGEPVLQVSGVADAGRPRVAGQEAGHREPGLVEQRSLSGDEFSGVVGCHVGTSLVGDPDRLTGIAADLSTAPEPAIPGDPP